MPCNLAKLTDVSFIVYNVPTFYGNFKFPTEISVHLPIFYQNILIVSNFFNFSTYFDDEDGHEHDADDDHDEHDADDNHDEHDEHGEHDDDNDQTSQENLDQEGMFCISTKQFHHANNVILISHIQQLTIKKMR